MSTHGSIAAALAQRSIGSGQRVRVRVEGTSMRPLLDVGDYVWLEQIAPGTLRPGDVVTVWQHNSLLTHRVIRTDGEQCVTKGDNCCADDGVMGYESIIGRVVVLERRAQRIDLRCRRWHACGSVVAWVGEREVLGSVHAVPRAVGRAALRWGTYGALWLMLFVEELWLQQSTRS